jgi:hypothetical protein
VVVCFLVGQILSRAGRSDLSVAKTLLENTFPLWDIPGKLSSYKRGK